MANINGSNMDDLFRQASDQYPLRTNSSDWNRLANALDANPSLVPPQGVEKSDNRRRRRVLWLLLLPLMAGGLGYYAWLKPAARKGGSGMNYAKAVPAENGVAGSNNEALVSKNEAAGSNKVEGADAKGVNVEGVNEKVKNMGSGRENEVKIHLIGANAHPGVSGNGVIRNGGSVVNGAGKNTGIAKNGPRRNGVTTAGGSNAGIVAGPGTGNEFNTGSRHGAGLPHDLQYSKVNGVLAMTNHHITVPGDIRAGTNRNSVTKTVVLSSPPAEKKTTATRKHSIYVGLLGAPDLSTIKFQNVRSLGTTFGILGGYTLNNKWSLETGIYLDKKEYYTDGRYFSTEKIPGLQNPYVDLKNVYGSCNMLEIPVNVRYNLSSGQIRTWFATAGLNTYLMYKENYQYQTVWNNTNPPQISPVYTYKTPYQYLFSIIDLSFGYEQKLGKIGNLRIEPYLRIPMSGIGTGDLSILSAGLNLGITRRIW